MTQHDPLVLLAHDFQLWRQHKTRPQEPVPKHLRQRVLSLPSSYSISLISKTLRICSSQLRDWKSQLSGSEFVSLPNAESPSISESSLEVEQFTTLDIELTIPNAAILRLSGHLSPSLLRLLLQEARSV